MNRHSRFPHVNESQGSGEPAMRTRSRQRSCDVSLYIMFACKAVLVALAFVHLG